MKYGGADERAESAVRDRRRDPRQRVAIAWRSRYTRSMRSRCSSLNENNLRSGQQHGGDPASLIGSVRNTIRELDPMIPRG